MGSVPEISKWTILLIKSDLKWCIHLSSKSLYISMARTISTCRRGHNCDNVILTLLKTFYYHAGHTRKALANG